MALRDLLNFLLTSHGDGLIGDDERIVLYDLYSSKNPGFRVTFVFVWKRRNGQSAKLLDFVDTKVIFLFLLNITRRKDELNA